MIQSISEWFKWVWPDVLVLQIIFCIAIAGCLFIVGLIIFGIYYWIYSMLDKKGSKWYICTGVVISHSYQAATTSIGVGYAGSANGGGPIVTSSSTPEEYILFVREMVNEKESGIFKFDLSMESYFNHRDGMRVEFWKRIGRISNSVIDWRLKL